MNTLAVTIRAARLSDAPDVARLTIQLGYELEESTAADRLSRILPRADQQLFLAESGGRCLGWVHAAIAEFLDSGAFVVIAGLVVDREHRRMGIGRSLMDAAEQWAAKQGCSVVRLWSSAARESAHRFYEGLGYRKIKVQYSFVKVLDSSGENDVSIFVPRIGG